MKAIGILGGMSWESTVTYYQLINRAIKQRVGGLHSAKVIVYSFDFAEIAHLQSYGDWDEAARLLSDAARILEQAEAEVLVVATNTMHLVYPKITEAIKVPVLHIADATAHAIQAQGFRKVGLLATRFTMEQGFYIERFAEHGISVIVPNADDRSQTHNIIYDELCQGITLDSSRNALVRVVDELVKEGSEAIILGCTELGLLINHSDFSVPIFDSTYLHAQAAVDFCLR